MTHFLQRTALILLGGSALCACTTTGDMRPDYPVRTAEPAAPAPAPVVTNPEPPAYTPPPARDVEQTPLAPLAPAAPRAEPRPPVVQPYTPPAPAFETTTRRTVAGRVVDIAGKPQTYVVKKGDNLARIADKLGMSLDDLKDANGIKGSTIRPGQTLKGPSRSAKAYVVGQGDTLFAVARRFSVTAQALRDENDLAANASIRSGQRLRLPSGYRDRGPTVTTERTPVARAEAFPSTVTIRPARPAPAEVQDEPASEPSYRTVTRRTITGRVVEVEGPRQSYTVKKGDNLNRIADKLNTTVDALQDDNNLKRSTIQPGQVLKGPRSTVKAYVAGSGDTLAGVAKRFGVTEAALRSENNYKRSAQIKAGDKVKLPDGYRDRGPVTISDRVAVPGVRPQPAPVPYTPPPRAYTPAPPRAAPPQAAPQPYVPPPRPAYTPPPAYVPPAASTATPRPYTPPSGSPSAPAGAPVAAPSASDAQVSQMGRGRFAWPLRGEIISDFGPKAGNQRNDGVNIRASAGDPVRAAASGDVVYAGDQVPGFGNLVLIKHPDGWVTAYGHLARVDVKMQQKVSAGQQIGQAGSTGGVTEPQLHFEVRYASSPLERARPVDPKLVLPR